MHDLAKAIPWRVSLPWPSAKWTACVESCGARRPCRSLGTTVETTTSKLLCAAAISLPTQRSGSTSLR
eukprot:4347695-Prymnesium_polylepis.1